MTLIILLITRIISILIHMDTITIPRKKYAALKSRAKIDWALVNKLRESFEDIMHGRITEWNPAKLVLFL